jgi:signal transduction histidine kinase/DNA-binding response OmpR family regulator/purine-cytosine permease-like protein
MTAHQRIVRVRRSYNKWVANQTLEDYALRFTAKSARKWSSLRVANTAIGAISFLALEAIGGAITVNYGFANATSAILVVGGLIFLTGLPIAYYAATYGVDIDLLTRGAGFGYIGSTVTSLIYASFTFLFFAIEAAIMSLALELWFGLPLFIGYFVSSVVVIPLVTHGITFISRLQLWTQPIWIILHLLPFAAIALSDAGSFEGWTHYGGRAEAQGATFNLVLFGAASTVVFSLIAQIGEQVDFLRFLPVRSAGRSTAWWVAYLAAGPGWVIPGLLKLLAGSFLAYLAVQYLVPIDKAAEPTQMYLVAFGYVFSSPKIALAFTCVFVIISQIKINVTNAYAGSIAWSNFFSRLTHSHPGRVVWLVFNVAIALLLMELGIFKALEHILGLYSIVAVAWVGALVADLIVNKPLGLSPPFIEFKRAHLYDVNPVGVGSMFLATAMGIIAYSGALGVVFQALSSFVALGVAFVTAPAIAAATRGKFYLARAPRKLPDGQTTVRCCICEHSFEPEDMAHCPAYSGPICSLCCSLETRCRDCCKPEARISNQFGSWIDRSLPASVVKLLNTDISHFVGVLSLFAAIIGSVLIFVYFQMSFDSDVQKEILRSSLWTVFCILAIIAGITAWVFVLVHESRRVAEEETQRQTELLMQEIEAHKRTDAKLQEAKEKAEAASKAKSRYVVGLSHELRTPLNAVVGYAQILERDPAIPARRHDAIRIVRRNAEYLSGLIDGLLDISKIEAGRFHLNRNEVRLRDFFEQLVDMFRLQAKAKGIEFRFIASERLPPSVYTDENRLRQILINLLSNAIKFTDVGHVTMRVDYRNQVACFSVEDTGIGIHPHDLDRIFLPFERAQHGPVNVKTGTGLGLTITKMLAETMGGEISVRSEIGRGSLFQVRLMLAVVARPRSAPPIEHRVRGYDGPRQTILVADDDQVHRDLVCELLEPLGFNLTTAANGTACLALVAERRPNLILLDISMPDMDGWAVARRLRQTLRERPAIIMLSALAMEEGRALESERLYDDYMIKPIDLRQLLEKFHTLLNIEWTTHDQLIEHAPLAPASTKSLALDTINVLIQLGQIGHFRGISATLDEIEINFPDHAASVAELRALVNSFNLSRFLSVLEAQRRTYAS